MAKTATQRAKPGRKPNPKHEQVGPDLVSQTPPELVEQEAAARREIDAQQQHLAVIDEQYGDNLPYDPVRLENEVRFYLQESAEAMLEAGKRLLVLKEREEHGRFTDSLARIGLHERAARRMMQAALKFCDSKRTTLSVLGRSKMLELMIEDDEELDALAAGGALGQALVDTEASFFGGK